MCVVHWTWKKAPCSINKSEVSLHYWNTWISAPVLDLLADPDDLLNSQACRVYQCSSGNQADYAIGQVYTYDYDVTSVTQMKSSPEDSSALSLKLRAKIQTLSSCRFSLQVSQYSFIRLSRILEN